MDRKIAFDRTGTANGWQLAFGIVAGLVLFYFVMLAFAAIFTIAGVAVGVALAASCLYRAATGKWPLRRLRMGWSARR